MQTNNTTLKKIKLPDKEGNLKEYEVIAYINNDIGNYIVYTANEVYKDGNIKLYINCLVKQDDHIVLDEVTEEELHEVIEKLQERLIN